MLPLEQWTRVVLLLDHNTRVVTLGTMALGLVAGLVGVFALLRKRSLVGDVVGHASLPGIAIAFLVMERVWPGQPRSLAGLLCGATLSGAVGVWATTVIRRGTRIKDDAALSIVLSVSFGLAMVLFTIIQSLPTGNAAGLNRFIFGSAASLLEADAWFMVRAAGLVLLVCGLLFKELTLLCFDESFAATQGWPTHLLDLVLMGMIVAVAEIGAQSVGLILVAALLIIPAAAARFWSERLSRMAWGAAILGAGSAYLGVLVSALAPRLATGAVIILVAGCGFVLSLFFGASRGLVWRLWEHAQLQRRVGRHDLLRAFYECQERRDGRLRLAATSAEPGHAEAGHAPASPIEFAELSRMRAWTAGRLLSVLDRAVREKLVERVWATGAAVPGYRLTGAGLQAARQAARNHRLWELFLIHYASIAPSHVDRDADEIEHVLGAPLVTELERLLAAESREPIPASPHELVVAAVEDAAGPTPHTGPGGA